MDYLARCDMDMYSIDGIPYMLYTISVPHRKRVVVSMCELRRGAYAQCVEVMGKQVKNPSVYTYNFGRIAEDIVTWFGNDRSKYKSKLKQFPEKMDDLLWEHDVLHK